MNLLRSVRRNVFSTSPSAKVADDPGPFPDRSGVAEDRAAAEASPTEKTESTAPPTTTTTTTTKSAYEVL
eukprot:CAMPEP_0114351818 /NCGR_PEP_ID=MMETSP0101-20121206/17479_1 /TAXON_ID=38822 ORGANISM="Pteridomonas danica, Strain PT" /NCGR_SAMPLE_ID=MMETSP0101 /ASSEMBLY_ACC=CAM_ASM_000211 /LENGTH=69 /DNA_ID=CAMNT_0001491905 /DNA_START=17 /DNA_END=223 /DNA_ORIENTATION=+